MVRRALLVLLVSGAVSACAAIWGFQDAIELADGGSADAADDATSVVDAESTDGFSDAAISDGAAAQGDASSNGDAPADAVEDDAAPLTPCACAPPLPGFGWSGPFELYQLVAIVTADGGVGDAGAGTGAPPAFPACGQNSSSWAEALDLHGVPEAGLAECACSCGAPSAVACSTPLANYFDDPMCRISCGISATTVDNACTALAAAQPGCMNIHTELSTTLEDAGTCGVDASTVVPPISWQGLARLCSPSPLSGTQPMAGTCEAGICVPGVESAFENAYCIIYADIVACPDAGYSVPHAYDDAGHPYYASAIDTRTCTPCGCQPPTGVGCVLDAGTSTDLDMSVCVDPTPYSGCTSIGSMATFATATAEAQGGACATMPEGGQAAGMVVPTAPYTICCTE